jgi:putative inorganic carbon (hco3(-)) transporter
VTAAATRVRGGVFAGAAGAAAVVGALAVYQPGLTVAALLAFAVGIVLARQPEAAVLVVVLLVWLNVPALGVKEYDIPRTAGAVFPALLVFPVAVRMFTGKRFELDRPLMLLLGLLGVQAVGTALSDHVAEALDNTVTYGIEGVLIYALVLNSVESFQLLRRALWMILGAAAFLCAFPIFQAVTGSWQDSFGGLAQVNAGFLRNPEGTARAAGPIGDPNYFAQILVPAVAIGYVAFGRESPRLRLLAMTLTWVVIAGIFLTYSRGAIIAVAFLFVAMVAFGYVRARWLVALIAIVPLLAVAIPSYTERVQSVASAIGGAGEESGSDRQADIATQGRVGEVKTAFYVFADHPILGVGPGVFPLYYQDYAERHGIEAHDRSFVEERLGEQPPRQAHSMPAAIAADLGLIGLVVMTWLFAAVMWALSRARWRSHLALSDAATALLLAIASYLVAGLFLTLAFERYLWLLVALGGVAVRLSFTARRRNSATRSS